MYASGQGAASDPLEAYAWLHRAARAGVGAAAGYLPRVAARIEPALLAQAQRYLGESEAA
jgi:TPR repeat protein